LATGLIALLDDVAAIAKVAAATLDDIAGQAAKAGAKAAGVVIDDAAVTPRYVTGFASSRELPIVRKIAIGSLKNKLVYLLPAALALSALAPWAITPLLMIGGAFLCYEGAEKVYEAVRPHDAHARDAAIGEAPQDAVAMENTKVSGAIKTDFILSAEIMAIALATIPDAGFWAQALILAAVGTGITLGVYGLVALIVKADDAGVALASGRLGGGAAFRAIGRGLVIGMPPFLKLLGVVGTAAMLWVGGGILLHGFEHYGYGALAHLIHDVAAAAGRAVPAIGGMVEWLIGAAAAGLVGLAVGVAIIPLVERVARPVAKRLRRAPA
jgi:predicted DNA repair protein MutK